MLEKVYFSGKGPGQGQISGLQSHGTQIPDYTPLDINGPMLEILAL
jgi:hypothetical protein